MREHTLLVHIMLSSLLFYHLFISFFETWHRCDALGDENESTMTQYKLLKATSGGGGDGDDDDGENDNDDVVSLRALLASTRAQLDQARMSAATQMHAVEEELEVYRTMVSEMQSAQQTKM